MTPAAARPDDHRQLTLFPEAAAQPGVAAAAPSGWGDGRRVLFTGDELASVILPPSGRYLVRVEQIRCHPDGASPAEIEAVVEILEPAHAPSTLADLFELRAHPSGRLSTRETRRLIAFLLAAGLPLRPGVAFDLQDIIGAELVAQVRQQPAPTGFPYTSIVSYYPADSP